MTALILSVLVKASLIMAAAGVAAVVSRRASAAKRHMLLTVSIVALLALPVCAAVLPSLRIPVPAAAPVNRIAAVVNTGTARTPAPVRKISSIARDAATTVPAAPEARPLPWATILFAGYLAGALVLAVKLIVERAAVRRLSRQSIVVADSDWNALLAECVRETGVTTSVRLLRSLDRTMPMTFGVVRPAILIPSVADTWTADRRRAVLLHELSHIARRDCLTQLLTRLACALYWPHPGAWLIARRLRVERELACDDRVLSTGAAAPDYAQHLLELAYSLGGYRAPALVLSMARPKQLEGRMLAVLDRSRNRTMPAARLRVAAFAAAALFVVPLAAAEFAVIPEAVTFVAEKGASVPSAAPSAPVPAAGQASSARQQKRREIQLPGTWSLRTSENSNRVSLQLSERRNSMSGFDLPLSELQGLSPSALSGNGPVKFALRRDAGTINFDGTIRAGVGAGTFDFTPSQTFPAELARRGYERPTNDELYVMARNDIGTAYLDELAKQKYERPSLDELLRAGDHGVDLDYLHDMGGAGYHLGRIEGLIRTRDHGVDLEFVDGLKAHGLSGLSVDELVRSRDHGVDPDYIAEMKDAGYDLHDIDGLVHARDHGVDAAYIQDMRHHGYKLSLGELVNARDHGVDDEFVASWTDAGYKELTIGELIRLRDHGVSASWAKRQNSGRSRLSVEELIRRRDRGGDH